ncbi:MAG: glycosyltransferase family 39 protein [Candidatus Promineifilaceae bacterium]
MASRSVWYDKAIEYWTAVVPLTDLFHVVSTSMHDPPLYSFLLNLWFMIGIDELWARLPAFYASMIALAGILHIGRKYYGWKVGLVAGLFFAISAADIRYAQEIGQYSLMICLTVWNFHFLLRATQQRKLYDWLLWGGTAALSLYSHYGSAIIIFTTSATALCYLVYRRHWQAIAYQVTTGIVVILSLIPIFVFIMPTQMSRLGAEPLAINFREFVAISSRILAFPIVSMGAFIFGLGQPTRFGPLLC